MRLSSLLLPLNLGLLLAPYAYSSNISMEYGTQTKSSMGYSVSWPSGYQGLRDERDNGMETVVVWPKSSQVAFSDMGDIDKIKKLGLVVMDVYPRTLVSKTFDAFAAETAADFKRAGQTIQKKTFATSLGEAVLVRVTSEPTETEILTSGKIALYTFTAGDFNNPALQMMLRSLQETSGGQEATPAGALKAFMGNFGYMLNYPGNYDVTADFADKNKTRESAYFFPIGTPQENLSHEDLYNQLGIIRLEVSPIKQQDAQGNFTVGLKELRAAIQESLERNQEKFTIKNYPFPLPAFRVFIDDPSPIVQIVIQGAKVTYIFTSGSENRELRGVIRSLQEVAPTDKPGQ